MRPRVVAKRNNPALRDFGRKQQLEPANAITGGEGSLPMSVQTMKSDDATCLKNSVSDES